MSGGQDHTTQSQSHEKRGMGLPGILSRSEQMCLSRKNKGSWLFDVDRFCADRKAYATCSSHYVVNTDSWEQAVPIGRSENNASRTPYLPLDGPVTRRIDAWSGRLVGRDTLAGGGTIIVSEPGREREPRGRDGGVRFSEGQMALRREAKGDDIPTSTRRTQIARSEVGAVARGLRFLWPTGS